MRAFVNPVLVLAIIVSAVPLVGRSEMRTVSFQGWEDCLEITNGTARLVVAPSAGGRILHYSRDGGPNVLWEDPRAKGETLEEVERWFPVGGYQLDIGPEIKRPPQHLPLWVGRYKVEKLGPLAVRLTSPEDPATSIQLIKEIHLNRQGAGALVAQTMKNAGAKDASYCLWDRTLTPGGGYGIFPLNRNSRFPARWSVRRGTRGQWSYDGVKPESARVRIVGDFLITVPGKEMFKVGADCETGWVAAFRDGWLLVKQFPVDPQGNYSDGGNRVEIYVDERVAEIEPLSPEVRLAPGQTYSFNEQWQLSRVERPIERVEDIPNLFVSFWR